MELLQSENHKLVSMNAENTHVRLFKNLESHFEFEYKASWNHESCDYDFEYIDLVEESLNKEVENLLSQYRELIKNS